MDIHKFKLLHYKLHAEINVSMNFININISSLNVISTD